MNTNRSRLESLPNEIFMEIFQYFDIKEIFGLFYNLNQRLNTLLQSVNHLIFKLYDSDYTSMSSLLTYVDHLNVYCQVNVNFQDFKNIRYLNLIQLPNRFLEQLDMKILPYLENLSVQNIDSNLVNILYNHIFSNRFPHLKSCYISQKNELQTFITFTYLPVLCNLQTGLIDLHIYQTILSISPNLNSFKFRLKSNEISVNVKPHYNLKRMIIKPDDYIQSKNDYVIDICLSFVPNLEQLAIDQDFFQINIPYYLQSNWHISVIEQYLPRLRRFNYYLRSWHLIGVGLRIVNIVDEMQKNFQNIHNQRYQSQFYFKYIY